jgi:two-component system, OmpR family, sensor histidine kinase VicK
MKQSIDILARDVAADVFTHFTNRTEQAIFIVDLYTSKVMYINPAFQALCDIKRQDEVEVLRHVISTIHEEDRKDVISKTKKYIDTNLLNHLEFRIVNGDGIIKWISLTLFINDGEDGKKRRLLGFAENATKRKDYESYLFKHNSKKNSIIQILAHDIKGPLSNISMIANLLHKQNIKGAFKDGNNLIGMIQKACDQTLRLITEYVNREFLESSTIEIVKSKIEIVERGRSITDMLTASHSQLDRNVQLEARPDKIWIEVDDVKILQVINNLMSNAVKFTRSGGSIYLKLEEKENDLLIVVQDNGIGIPEKLQPFIFDEFTKSRRKGLRGEETVGLGLSIAKKMVELHKGKIWFESKEGEGTTFFITLPK